MKKVFLTALLALLCLTTLAACSSSGADADPTGYETKAVTLLADGGAFSEPLETLDGETAFLLYRFSDYGLEAEVMTDCAVLRSSGATCEEAAVVIWQTEEQAIQAKEALEDYIQSQIEANVDYRPAEVPKLEEARVSRLKNTVLLVIANDMAAAEQAVPALTAS